MPELPIVLNGGIASVEQAAAHLEHVDGVMMGRAAYQEPWRLLAVDPLDCSASPRRPPIAKAAAEALIPYIERELARGARLHAITRHMLGLFRGVPGARAFRRHLATEAVKARRRRRDVPRCARAGATARPSCAHRLSTLSQRRAVHNDPRRAGRRTRSGLRPRSSSAASSPGFWPACSASAAAPSSCRCSTRCSACSACRKRSACSSAIGTSLAIIVPTNIRSYLAHRASGAVLTDVVRQWTLPAVVGVGVGSLIASVAPARCSRSPS